MLLIDSRLLWPYPSQYIKTIFVNSVISPETVIGDIQNTEGEGENFFMSSVGICAIFAQQPRSLPYPRNLALLL